VTAVREALAVGPDRADRRPAGDDAGEARSVAVRRHPCAPVEACSRRVYAERPVDADGRARRPGAGEAGLRSTGCCPAATDRRKGTVTSRRAATLANRRRPTEGGVRRAAAP